MKARGAGALRGTGGGGKAGERSREGGGALSHNSKTISATLGPASAQAIGPDARIKPLNCASQSSPFPGAHGHSYEVERRSRAGGSWGGRESARTRPGSSPGEKPRDGTLPRHSPTPRGGLPSPAPVHPQNQGPGLGGHRYLTLEDQQANLGRWGDKWAFWSPPAACSPAVRRGRRSKAKGLEERGAVRRGAGCTEGTRALPSRDGSKAVPESLPPPPSQSELWKGRSHPVGPEQALRWGGGRGGGAQSSAYPRGGIQRLLSRRGTGVAAAGPQQSQGPGNRKARTRHWTQDPTDPEAAVRVTGQKGQCLPLPRPSPGWPPASASGPRDPQTPTQTWPGKLTRGEQLLQPQERQRDMGRGSDGNSKHLPGPTAPRNSRVSNGTGQSGERKARSGAAAR